VAINQACVMAFHPSGAGGQPLFHMPDTWAPPLGPGHLPSALRVVGIEAPHLAPRAPGALFTKGRHFLIFLFSIPFILFFGIF
jgi:hypothetical protein